ncbi:MAG: hypothetical protein E6J45_13880 [Chloroflexi bacterium]|nr:MAG: hypothetical protein E6J45_13880 [Chloroflexota bacterium]
MGSITIGLTLWLEQRVGSRDARGEEKIAFSVASEQPMTLDSFRESACRPLQDLITFATGVHAPVTRLEISRPPSRHLPFPQWVQVLESGPLGEERIESGSWPRLVSSLFTLAEYPGGFDVLIPRWLDLHRELHLPINMLLLSDYMAYSYADRFFFEACQAIEGFHRHAFGQPANGAEEEHYERVMARLREKAVGARDRGWLKSKLKRSLEPSLEERITAVIAEAGPLLAPVTAAWPNFSRAVSDTRNAMAHVLGAKTDQRIDDPARMQLAAEVMRWAVRIGLLRRLWPDADEVTPLLRSHWLLTGLYRRV